GGAGVARVALCDRGERRAGGTSREIVTTGAVRLADLNDRLRESCCAPCGRRVGIRDVGRAKHYVVAGKLVELRRPSIIDCSHRVRDLAVPRLVAAIGRGGDVYLRNTTGDRRG